MSPAALYTLRQSCDSPERAAELLEQWIAAVAAFYGV